MMASRLRTLFQRIFRFLRRSWRGVVLGIAKWLVVIFMVVVAFDVLLGGSGGPSARVFALFIFALFGVALVYWIVVPPRVRLDVPGLSERVEGSADGEAGADGETVPHGAAALRGWRERRERQQDYVKTVQVTRLDTTAAQLTVVNEAPVPVLRAEMALTLVREPEDGETPDEQVLAPARGQAFSIPARRRWPVTVSRTFDHVGIFRLRSTGIRVFGILGLLSRVRGPRGQWRVRVVPNIYRLMRGVPKDRKMSQSDLGIPDIPSDALDYDRVREYRPGDPLKTIHWNLVAHGGGELFTKLFEAATVSGVTLLIDPYGPSMPANRLDDAYHMYDTMLEGAFSLVEHARQADIAVRLRFVRRDGSLVDASWEGPAMLGWFVETVRRPAPRQDARDQSALAIRSLRNGRTGYVILATCQLTYESVRELIACHHAGVPLLVVHALPAHAVRDCELQQEYDARLREASIGVVDLTHGSQIVQEVALL